MYRFARKRYAVGGGCLLGFYDVHTHVSDDKLSCDIENVRNRYLSAGVTKVIDSGCDAFWTEKCKNNAEKFPEIYYTAGIHPENTKDCGFDEIEKIAALTNSEKCVAIGEIGLDYHYDGFDKQVQAEFFKRQLVLADKLSLPVVVHSRDACKDTLDILKENSHLLKRGFLMHCYSESAETAKELVKLGAYFSFGGALTYKNSHKGEIMKTIPLSRVMFETDAPYLAPVPFRGTVNEPKNVIFAYEYAAGVYGITINELKAVVSDNVYDLFGI